MIAEKQLRSLGTELPREMARCRELLVDYCEIGPSGQFAATMLRQALKLADEAIIQGDLVAMIRVYNELKGFQ
jgi:hypothetical protein